MINSLIRGFQQLFDPPTRRLVILSALTALGVLIVLAVVLWFVLAQFQFLEWQWAERAVEIGAGFLLFVLVWLLFPAALSATVGLFLDFRRLAGGAHPLSEPAAAAQAGDA